MQRSSELLNRYLRLSEELFSLDFETAFDKMEKLIEERELILGDLKHLELEERDKKTVALKIMELDRKIQAKFEEQKRELGQKIEQVKKEKGMQSSKRKAFNVYGEKNDLDGNIFFDKLK